MKKHVMKLHPFDDVCASAKEQMDKGAEIHQQFNCAHCGTKQTMAEANKMFTTGTCEECGKVTDIRKNGCNFMAKLTFGTAAMRDFFGKG